ncbi:MAG: hypothetical protein AB1466_01340 [Actinomycetota bacterium]
MERSGVDWISEGDKRPFFVLPKENGVEILHLLRGGFVIRKDISKIREIVKKFGRRIHDENKKD